MSTVLRSDHAAQKDDDKGGYIPRVPDRTDINETKKFIVGLVYFRVAMYLILYNQYRDPPSLLYSGY
jgi:hypothetical protein